MRIFRRSKDDSIDISKIKLTLSSGDDDRMHFVEKSVLCDRTIDSTPSSSPERTKEDNPSSCTLSDLQVETKVQQYPTNVIITYDDHGQICGESTQETDDSPFTVSTVGSRCQWDDCSDAGSSFVSSDFQASVFGDDSVDDSSIASELQSVRSTKDCQVHEKFPPENVEEKCLDFPTLQEFEDLDEIERIDAYKRMRTALVEQIRIKSHDDTTNAIQKPLTNQPQDTASVDPTRIERIQVLEKELLNVSTLLEQTIRTVERLEKIPRRFFRRLWTKKTTKTSRNSIGYSDDDIRHLERMCKIHQFTILKQNLELQAVKDKMQAETCNLQLEVDRLSIQVNNYEKERETLHQTIYLSSNDVNSAKSLVYEMRQQISQLNDEKEALEAKIKICGFDPQWII
jgi:hypothetical protein